MNLLKYRYLSRHNRHTSFAPMKVFVSYSHDSREHERRVLDFADQLRANGIDAIIDQYVPSPPEGWPRWMERRIAEADVVLVVCTATYLRRVEGREVSAHGLGVAWESNLIYQHIYNAGSVNNKFVPVLLEGATISDIPFALQGVTYYRIFDNEDDHRLFLRLTRDGHERAVSYSVQPVYDHGSYLDSALPAAVAWQMVVNAAVPHFYVEHLNAVIQRWSRDGTLTLRNAERQQSMVILNYEGSRIGFDRIQSAFRHGHFVSVADIRSVKSIDLESVSDTKWYDIAEQVKSKLEALPAVNASERLLFPLVAQLFRRPAFYAIRERDWRLGLFAVVKTRIVYEQAVLPRLRERRRRSAEIVLKYLLDLENLIAEQLSLTPSELSIFTADYICDKAQFVSRLPRSWQTHSRQVESPDTPEQRRCELVEAIGGELAAIGIHIPNLGRFTQHPDQPLEDDPSWE